MEEEITLSIPSPILQRARQIAEREMRPLSDVLNDAIASAFPAIHVGPKREQMKREEQAFQTMLDDLKRQYTGEFVAILEGKVIDHDADRLSLVERLDEKYPQRVVLVRRVTSSPPQPLRAPSPRFVQQ